MKRRVLGDRVPEVLEEAVGFSQDWANYGSSDESYFEDADTMYKPSQIQHQG